MDTYYSIIIYISLFFGLYYQIFILVTFFENKPRKYISDIASMKSTNLPSVTIIVPCYNEEKTLEKTVNSLLNLKYPIGKLFISIIDDGSLDATYSKALELTKHKNVKAFTQKNGGKYTALNFGIKNSQTEIVGCLDADSMVHEDSLLKMIPLFKDKKVAAVTPAMKVFDPKNILQKIQNTEYNIGIFLKKIMGQLDAIHVTPGPFSLFKKSIFDKIGYLKHAHNTEDMEIAFRIQENRYRIENCPTAFVYTITPSTLKRLYIQRTRWTYGFIKNVQDYKHMLFNPKYGNLGMLTLPFASIATVIALLLFSYFIYNIINYFYIQIQKFLTIGFNLHFSSLDPFYINTSITTLLTLAMFLISVTIISISWKAVEGKNWIKMDVIYFIFLYAFIAPLWLTKASYNAVTSKITPWR